MIAPYITNPQQVLTDEQLAAVETDLPQVLVSAGPGTGKTRVIAHRIGHLLETGVRADEILALVFTRNACREIKQRILAAGWPDAERVGVRTFHEQGAAATVWPIGLQVASEQEADAALRSLIEGPMRRPASEVPKLHVMRKQLVEYEASGGGTARPPEWLSLILARLHTARLVPTWDLVPRLLSVIAAGRAPCWDHVLVDEAMDATEGEQQMASGLSGGSLYAVGDPRQAIMGWRGAAPTWRWSPVTHRLTRTFRFGETIARAANAIGVGEPITGAPDVEDDVQVISRGDGPTLAKWIMLAPADTVILCRTHRDAETVAHLLPERLRHVERDPLDPLSSAADSIAAVRAEGKVPVCTIHSFKGLEADQVVLFAPSTSDYWSRRMAAGDAEENRVWFVGATRARRRLVCVEGDR